MKKKLMLICAAMALLFLVSGCGQSPAEAGIQDSKPVVAVSIVPQKTFVEAVCGDLADVVVMIPTGASPENYEPTPMQMEDFSRADIYFSIGVQSEEQGILPMVAPGTLVVDLASEVAESFPDRLIGQSRDPHIWLSPKRVEVMINAIAREMCILDPGNSANYNQNAQSFIAELNQADSELTSALEDVKNRSIIVYHPAFGYFADDYGLTMYALENEGKEATPKHLAEMTDLARKEGIKVIFYQAEVDKSQALAFAEEIGGQAMMLEPLSGDYIDNLHKMAEIIKGNME